MPSPPKYPIPDSLVLLPVVSPVEVCRHARVEPPTGAVIRAAVPGRIAVMVPVRGGERPVVVIIHFAEAESITSGTGVSAYRQSVAQPLACNPELLVLRRLRHPAEVLQLHPQHHVPVPGQQVDQIVPQPKLPSVQLAEPRAVLRPGAVEADAAVPAPLDQGPSSTVQLHVTEDREAFAADVRVHQVHSTFSASS